MIPNAHALYDESIEDSPVLSVEGCVMTCDPSDRMNVPLLWMKIFPHSGQINPGSLMAVEIIYKTYSGQKTDAPKLIVTVVGHLSKISSY